MSARAQKRSAESGMSAEAFSRMLQVDRSEYDAALKRFTERKGEAEAAERRAGERGVGQDEREEALDERQTALDAREAALAEKVSAFEEWVARYDRWIAGRAA